MKIEPLRFPLKDFFIEVFGEKVFLVGGTVRDYFLYRKIDERQDIDLLVVGHTYEEIEEKLKPHGKTGTVGKSFAVVKFSKDGLCFDISVPRKDIKRDRHSHSHQNFIIEYGPHIKLEEDLGRRDFTCNSIAVRLIDHEVIDPFDGVRAIEEQKIYMTGPGTFFDDPLRILRCARFASVHQFTVDENIYVNVKDVVLDELSKERVQEELFRLLLESEKPSIGLGEYFKLSVLEKLFPSLYALTLTIQDVFFHPEHDEQGHHTVWIHTMYAVDVARRCCRLFKLAEEQSLAVLLAVLFHDVGKAVTTRWEFKRGRMAVTSPFHDSKGVAVAEQFLADLKVETRKNFPLKRVVLNLVKNHHRIYDLYRNREEIGFRAVSRLVRDLEDHDFLLVLLDFADRQSREPDFLNFSDPDGISHWWLKQKEAYNINRDTIQPLVRGRDLLELGIPPGVEMGKKLKQLYELQLDGEFTSREAGLTLFQKLQKQGKI
jgi:tRNA nucleotidyltransferase (CCA-adding enzyme)